MARTWAHPLSLFLLLILCGACGSTPEPRSQKPATVDAARSLADKYFRLGQDSARAGDNLRAEQYLLAAQKAGYPEARLLPPLLEVCLSSGRLRTALSYAEPYLQSHPDEFVLRHLLSTVYLALGDAAQAFHELQIVEAQAPEYAPAKYLLAVTSDEAFSDVSGARRYFEAYLKLAPHGPHAPEAAGWLREHRAVNRTRPQKVGS